MTDSVLKQFRRNSLREFFSAYWSICGLLHHKRDLVQLKIWATKKGLREPQAAYSRRCTDIEQRLWYWQRRAPFALAFAESLVGIVQVFSGKERYRRGYATKYKK